MHIHHGQLYGHAGYHRLRGRLGRPLDDGCHVRRSTAHVEGQEVVVAALLPNVSGAYYAPGGSGDDASGRVGDGVFYRHHPAGRLHDQWSWHTGRLGFLGQVREVCGEPRSQIGVRGRRGEPLVFPELRQYLAAEGDVKIGQCLPQRITHLSLVVGVHEREEQAHGDGLDFGLFHRGNGLLQAIFVERGDLALRSHPFGDHEAQFAWYEGWWAVVGQVVEGRTVL